MRLYALAQLFLYSKMIKTIHNVTERILRLKPHLITEHIRGDNFFNENSLKAFKNK